MFPLLHIDIHCSVFQSRVSISLHFLRSRILKYKDIRMPRSSKLARRMALKKKIEEEFRLAEERAKVPKVSIYDKYWDRQDLVVVNKQDKIIEEKICIPNIERECFQKEEPIKDDIKDIIPTKDNIVEENRVLEHKIILEEKTTADKKVENKESKRKLKKKKKNIKTVEEFELKEVEQLQEDETFRLNRLFDREKTEHISEEKREEEMKITEEKIKELEESIACLDNDLERYEIERMREKTKRVVKRMNTVLGYNEVSQNMNMLKEKTVKGFMSNNILWGKYLTTRIKI